MYLFKCKRFLHFLIGHTGILFLEECWYRPGLTHSQQMLYATTSIGIIVVVSIILFAYILGSFSETEYHIFDFHVTMVVSLSSVASQIVTVACVCNVC